jgi:hypothetical protein
VAKWLKRLPSALVVVTEIHLAVFYLRGQYYDVVKRVLGIHHVCVLHFHILVFILMFPRYPLFQRIHIHDRRLTHYLGS